MLIVQLIPRLIALRGTLNDLAQTKREIIVFIIIIIIFLLLAPSFFFFFSFLYRIKLV